MDIGRTLREARLRQGIDISDVEEETKIRAKFLRALENEEWQVIPEDVYVRKFLETYSRSLGLDPRPLVELYVIRSGAPDATGFRPGGEIDRRVSPRLARFAAAALLLCVLALLALAGSGRL